MNETRKILKRVAEQSNEKMKIVKVSPEKKTYCRNIRKVRKRNSSRD